MIGKVIQLVHTSLAMPSDDLVTEWFHRLQERDPNAVRPLWDSYFHRLVALARNRLRDAPRHVTDEEDVALSVFDSFCRNAEAGRFPSIADRDDLWRLLAAFTLRKAAHYLRDAARLKRGGGASQEHRSEVLADLLAREPDPGLAAEVAEEFERLLARLKDPELRQVALLRMEGHSVEDVASAIGCAPRSVKRKLQLIRVIWEREGADEGA